MKFIDVVFELFVNTWSAILDFLVVMTGLSESVLNWTIIIILAYFILLFILLWIHRRLKKKRTSLKVKLIEAYDKIFYLLARRQYRSEIDKASIGGDPCIAAIKPLLKEGNRDYLRNHDIIESNVKKVEKLLGENIIGESDWSQIRKLHGKLAFANIFQKIFGIVLSVITVGVYLLFR